MDGLTSLSISLHAAARHVRESMGGHPRWLGDLPSGLCNLPRLTELDLSFRAFGQTELCLPQVCATTGSPACLPAWVLLIATRDLIIFHPGPRSLVINLYHRACEIVTLLPQNACVDAYVSHAGLHTADIPEEAEAGLLREGVVPPRPGQRHAEAAG